MAALGSLLFYLGLLVTAPLVVIAELICLVVPVAWRYPILSQWARIGLWWLKITCRLDYRVEGLENIPRENGIILAKHQSAWETLALQRLFPRQTWVLKRSLLWVPLIGWGLALLGSVAIDRKAGKKALRQVVEQGSERLGRGLWIVIFPEGTRTLPGTRGEYHIGGAFLAAKSGYPVVPVAHNAGEFWPRNSFIKQPGTITLAIGPVIESKGRRAAEINALAEEWIEAKVSEIGTRTSN